MYEVYSNKVNHMGSDNILTRFNGRCMYPFQKKYVRKELYLDLHSTYQIETYSTQWYGRIVSIIELKPDILMSIKFM